MTLCPPPGNRRSGPALCEADRLAADFRGLPPGVTRWQVLAATRRAAQRLGLTATAERLLAVYIDHSYDVDWQAGSEPIITTPVVELAEALGISERQVRNVEAHLLALGLITFRDSANHARRGRRDRHSLRLISGYGPSLAPLAARFAEIDALAEEARREAQEVRSARAAIAALRRRLRADIAALEAATPQAARAAAEALEAEPARLPAATPLPRLAALRDRLAALAHHTAALLGAAVPANIAAPAETPDRPSIQRPIQECPRARSHHRNDKPRSARRAPPVANDHGLGRIPMRALSKLLAYRIWPDPNPVEAASHLCHELAIPPDAWKEACATLGRAGAAIAVMLIGHRSCPERTPPDRRVRNPAAYLRGLVLRGQQGRLRLDASLHALHRERMSSP